MSVCIRVWLSVQSSAEIHNTSDIALVKNVNSSENVWTVYSTALLLELRGHVQPRSKVMHPWEGKGKVLEDCLARLYVIRYLRKFSSGSELHIE